MKKLIVALALLTPLAAHAQNLIQNPSCEMDGAPPVGWVQVTGAWTCDAFPPTVPALEGTEYFYAGSSGDGELQQDINVTGDADMIDDGHLTATFSGFVRSWPQTPTDQGRIVVEYRDAANTAVLDSFDSGDLMPLGSWAEVADQRVVAVGTRFIRVRLLSTVNTGPSNDGYYDDLRLVLSAPVAAVPSLSEIGLGLLAALLITLSVTRIRRLG